MDSDFYCCGSDKLTKVLDYYNIKHTERNTHIYVWRYGLFDKVWKEIEQYGINK